MYFYLSSRPHYCSPFYHFRICLRSAICRAGTSEELSFVRNHGRTTSISQQHIFALNHLLSAYSPSSSNVSNSSFIRTTLSTVMIESYDVSHNMIVVDNFP